MLQLGNFSHFSDIGPSEKNFIITTIIEDEKNVVCQNKSVAVLLEEKISATKSTKY